MIGVPHVYDAFRAGTVAILNAVGNGVAEDKGIYYFVPKMIKYYLHEEPILQNAPTNLPFYPDDYSFMMDHFERLVIKDVAEAGGYGVVFASSLSKEDQDHLKDLVKKDPRRFIAQEVIDFEDLDILVDGKHVPRKADLRAFVLYGEEPVVWKSGLTRYTTDPNSSIVNSSQGGGFKDAWILSR